MAACLGTSLRARATAGDLVRSLVLVLAVVAVILLLNARDERPTAVSDLDFAGPLAQARQTASYDVLGPVGLGQRVAGHQRPVAPRATAGDLAHRLRDAAAVTTRGWSRPTGRPAEFVDRASPGAAAQRGTCASAGAPGATVEGGEPEPRALVLTRQRRPRSSWPAAPGGRELEALAGSLAVD